MRFKEFFFYQPVNLFPYFLYFLDFKLFPTNFSPSNFIFNINESQLNTFKNIFHQLSINFKKMEDELKCSYCNKFYCNPVLLPCFHSLCYTCAHQLQSKFNSQQPSSNTPTLKSSNSISPHSSISSSSSANIDRMSQTLSITDLGSSIVSDLDKLSVFSETDSGIQNHPNPNSSINSGRSSASSGSCHSSRPNSYMYAQSETYSNLSIRSNQLQKSLPAPPPLPLFPTTTLYSTFLPCPECNRMIYMDETGIESLTKNTCLENIVERYTDSKKVGIKCQMCPNDSDLETKEAVSMCEQCEIYYCEQCCEQFHPARGPLIKHVLVQPRLGRDLIKRRNRSKESVCADHHDENVSLYCLLCKCSCCTQCVDDTSHINHQMQPINTFCKAQKVSD